MSSDFHFLVPESFHTKFDSDREKIRFEFLYVHNLGPRSRNSLYLQYSHIFIFSIRCLLLLTFRSLAAGVSEKFTVFTFSYKKSLSYQILPCCKIGQGHSRVIIYTNYDGQESPMLHTKFHESLLVVCIYQLSGHRLQYFLKNPLFSLFPIEKPTFPNLTLPQNRSRSLQGHHLYKL